MSDCTNSTVHEKTHERLKSHGAIDASCDDRRNRSLDDWKENGHRHE